MKHKNIGKFFLTLLIFCLTPCFADATTDVDAYHTNVLNAQIAADPDLAPYKITVSSKQNLVSVTGTLPSRALAEELIEMVMILDSVQSIDTTQLTVSDTPPAQMINVYMEGMLRGLLIRNHIYSRAEVDGGVIKINADDRKITLSGSARSQEQINRAVAMAKTLNSVSAVTSNIQVGSY